MTDEQIMTAPEPVTEQAPAPVVTDPAPVGEPDANAQAEEEFVADETTTDAIADEETQEEDPATDPEGDTEPNNAELVEAKAMLDKLFTPFTANGKEIKVDNVDDAVRLMQMGAGFNKKMATLKPHLKIVKLLENNGLLDQDKLNHLIDLSKGDPGAISKLLADSNTDPLNLKPGTDYKPTSYTVDDSQMELDSVVDELRGSPYFTKTLEVVVDKWDTSSKEILVSNPEVIRVLHDQMSNGIYDQVTARVDYLRTLGHLKGLSDLAAYKQVGDDMDARKLFKHQAAEQAPANPVSTVPGVKANESNLKGRKLAASPTKASPGKKSDLGDFNPLTATDEEIANMSIDKFL